MDYSPDDNAYMIYIPVTIFLILCPLLVCNRMFVHWNNRGKLGADDWVILASMICSLASGGIMIMACNYGYGKHWQHLTPHNQRESMKFFYLCQVTYKLSINLTKMSILLLLHRIFNGIGWFRWSCVFVLTCVGMFCVAMIMATVFQCTPVAKAFDHSMPGHCINNAHFWYANAGFNITSDIVILALPMVPVYGLNIPRMQKAGVAVVFTLGIFVTITSCLRVTTIDIQAKTNDKTYDVSSTMWTIIEMNVAIVCACLAQIRPLVAFLVPKIVTLYRKTCSRTDNSTTRVGSAASGTTATAHSTTTTTTIVVPEK